MTIQNGDFTYYDRSTDKEWNKLLFIAGRVLQSAELNEIQSIIETFQARLGRTIFKDGDIIAGCQVKTNTTAKEAYISDGFIFIDGRIRQVTGITEASPLTITASGEEKIGLIRTITYVTENDDPTLRDPVEDWGVYGSAGAHREKYVYTWVVDDATAVDVFTLYDGGQKLIERPTQYSQIYEALARRTYDESGHYALGRFIMRADPNPDGTSTTDFKLVVEPNKAYVKGFELELGAAQGVIVDKGRDYDTVTAELQVKGQYSNLYELNSDFVKEVHSIAAPVFAEIAMTRGGTPGGKDEVPNSPLFKIFSINQGGVWDDSTTFVTCDIIPGQYVGGTTYTEGIDFYQEGNYIHWGLGGSEPNPGSTYRAAFLYTKTMVKGTRTETVIPSVPETVNRDTTASIDYFGYEDGVQGSLEFTDSLGNVITTPYKEGIDYEFVTGNNPQQVFLTGKDYSNEIGNVGIYWYPNALHEPTGTYYVKYSYWSHDIEGDYVSADSYSDYEKITVNFQSDLWYRDYIDFRGTETVTKDDPPHPQEHFVASYDYYLGRSDLVMLDQYGTIKVQRGRPSTEIIRPQEVEGTLTIGWADIPPYTYDLSNVYFAYKENIRFTMQDIHKLEDRVDRLEYFMTIDLLEQNALGKYTSSVKKGVFVDTFQGSKNADLAYNDGTHAFTISFDQERKCVKLKPIINQQGLTVGGSTTAKLNKYVYTLPFDETLFAEQIFATGNISVQPFEVFEWVGELSCDPEADVWVDTQESPDILANFENENAHIVDLETQWNSWQDVSVGREIVTSRQTTGGSLIRRRWRGWSSYGTAWGWKDRGIGRRTTATTGFRRATQERSGISRQLVPQNITQTLGDRVVNAGIVPFIRAQTITLTGEAMRPSVSGLKVKMDDVELTPYDQNPAAAPGRVSTDADGRFTCKVDIPAATFRIGRREIRVGNQDTASAGNETYCTCVFEAYGLSQTKADVVASVTVVNQRSQPVTERRQQQRFFTRRVASPRRRSVDPLAQSFTTDPNLTTYISSVDVFFAEKDSNIPVMLYLTKMDNGYPTTEILAKKSLNAADVNVSTDASVPTNFLFEDPVMVDPGTELAFVIYSTSPNYKAYYSELGENDIASGIRIIKNPYSGVMFTSANASTWQADGFKDLKFNLYKCNFENDCQMVFSNLSGVEAALLVLQTSQIIPDASEIKWFYSIDGGTSYQAINPLNNTPLTQLATQVTLRADITGAGLSPMIHKDRLGIILVKHDTTGNYISNVIDVGSNCNNIKLLIDKNVPNGTEVKVYFMTDEDNVWRGQDGVNDWDSVETTVIDETWTEYEYNIESLASFQKLRVRISFDTLSEVISPEAKRLRIIMT